MTNTQWQTKIFHSGRSGLAWSEKLLKVYVAEAWIVHAHMCV